MTGCEVWKENFEDQISDDLRLPPSLSFPSTFTAISSNGFNSIKILETGDRTLGTQWKVGFFILLKYLLGAIT